jgi:hypothetical protein
MAPLCIHSQRPERNGWQFVRWTGEPVDARMCAKSTGVVIRPAISRRFSSFQAGWVLLNTAGSGCSPYQPIPNPSPLVVVTPRRECRLWSMIEWAGRKSRFSARTGSPE